MAQHNCTRFVGCLGRDSSREHLANTTQPHVPKRIVTIVNCYHLTVFCTRTFSDDDHRITRPLRQPSTQIRLAKSSTQQVKNSFITKRMFRDEDQMRLSRHARPKRQMPGVPAHHFDNLHPTVRTSRCARTFDYLCDIPECGIKTERR